MNHHPMTCRQLADFILDYVEGRLPAAQVGEFERHLAACPPCVAYLDGYRRTIALGRAALAAGAPAEGPAPERLIEAVRAARRKGGASGC